MLGKMAGVKVKEKATCIKIEKERVRAFSEGVLLYKTYYFQSLKKIFFSNEKEMPQPEYDLEYDVNEQKALEQRRLLESGYYGQFQ